MVFCAGCGQHSHKKQLICQSCCQPSTARCARCGLAQAQQTLQCNTCQQHPPPWHRLHYLDDYRYPLNQLIRLFKQRNPLMAQHLVRLWLNHHRVTLPPVLTWVPMHWLSYLKRGYNPSHLLASQLFQQAGDRASTQLVSLIRKRRITKKQKRLTRQQRQHNVNHAFVLSGYAKRLVAQQRFPKHIGLVDDVVTTGATLAEITLLLQQAGAVKIEVFCLARTPS